MNSVSYKIIEITRFAWIDVLVLQLTISVTVITVNS